MKNNKLIEKVVGSPSPTVIFLFMNYRFLYITVFTSLWRHKVVSFVFRYGITEGCDTGSANGDGFRSDIVRHRQHWAKPPHWEYSNKMGWREYLIFFCFSFFSLLKALFHKYSYLIIIAQKGQSVIIILHNTHTCVYICIYIHKVSRIIWSSFQT